MGKFKYSEVGAYCRQMKSYWKDIEGFDGKYQISKDGNVKTIKSNGKLIILKPYFNSAGNYIVRLTKNNKRKEYTIIGLMAKTFLGPAPKGYVPHHKNKMKTDNYIGNIEYISRRELGLIYGKSSGRRPVAQINNKGEVVNFYSSAGEAARKNHLSKTTVTERCNGQRKSLFAYDGFAYAWEDKMYIIQKKIKKEFNN